MASDAGLTGSFAEHDQGNRSSAQSRFSRATLKQVESVTTGIFAGHGRVNRSSAQNQFSRGTLEQVVDEPVTDYTNQSEVSSNGQMSDYSSSDPAMKTPFNLAVQVFLRREIRAQEHKKRKVLPQSRKIQRQRPVRRNIQLKTDFSPDSNRASEINFIHAATLHQDQVEGAIPGSGIFEHVLGRVDSLSESNQPILVHLKSGTEERKETTEPVVSHDDPTCQKPIIENGEASCCELPGPNWPGHALALPQLNEEQSKDSSSSTNPTRMEFPEDIPSLGRSLVDPRPKLEIESNNCFESSSNSGSSAFYIDLCQYSDEFLETPYRERDEEETVPPLIHQTGFTSNQIERLGRIAFSIAPITVGEVQLLGKKEEQQLSSMKFTNVLRSCEKRPEMFRCGTESPLRQCCTWTEGEGAEQMMDEGPWMRK